MARYKKTQSKSSKSGGKKAKGKKPMNRAMLSRFAQVLRDQNKEEE